MSIGAASTLTQTDYALWLIWLGAAMLLASTTRTIRWPARRIGDESTASSVPLLAATAVLTFLVWLVTISLYSSALRRGRPVDEVFQLPAHHMVLLATVSPLIGWVTASGLLTYWRLWPTIGVEPRKLLRGVLAGVIGIVITLPLVMLTSQLMLRLWEAVGLEHADRHELLQIYLAPGQPWVRPMIWIAAVVLAPLFEEMLFRGLIQNAFTRVTHRPWAGILIASTMFALIHATWTAPAIFVLSIFIGVVYARTQNFYAAVTMHMLFNVFGLMTALAAVR